MICSTCGANKPDEEFHWRKVNVKRKSTCKVCACAYTSTHYQNNGAVLRDYVRSLKENTPCIDCGGVFHFSVMEYDHVNGNGDKIAAVSRLVNSRKTRSWTRVMEEIAKCELV